VRQPGPFVVRPAIDVDHRAALRALAYAVLADAILRASALRIRRTFVLSFPEDDFDPLDDAVSQEKVTSRMRVIRLRPAAGAPR
jgi:hypothetical protein